MPRIKRRSCGSWFFNDVRIEHHAFLRHVDLVRWPSSQHASRHAPSISGVVSASAFGGLARTTILCRRNEACCFLLWHAPSRSCSVTPIWRPLHAIYKSPTWRYAPRPARSIRLTSSFRIDDHASAGDGRHCPHSSQRVPGTLELGAVARAAQSPARHWQLPIGGPGRARPAMRSLRTSRHLI